MRGFVTSNFFFIYCTIAGAKNTLVFTAEFTLLKPTRNEIVLGNVACYVACAQTPPPLYTGFMLGALSIKDTLSINNLIFYKLFRCKTKAFLYPLLHTEILRRR